MAAAIHNSTTAPTSAATRLPKVPREHAEPRKNPAAQQTADHTEHQIHHQTRTVALDYEAGQPSGDQTDQKIPQKIHNSVVFLFHLLLLQNPYPDAVRRTESACQNPARRSIQISAMPAT